MKIYEVVFNDTGGPDRDRDASFLVRAEDFRSAVDEVLQNSGSRNRCSILPHSVYEIGEELRARFNSPDRRILRGPYFECAVNYGWREWRRKDLEPEKSELGRKYVWEEVIHEA